MKATDMGVDTLDTGVDTMDYAIGYGYTQS
jgi:hypothetical protein